MHAIHVSVVISGIKCWSCADVSPSKQTANLLGKQEFDILCGSGRKPFLTNISRGAAIDQEVLIDYLHSGKLRGAALDVQDPEPLPPDHPLWDAPNVIVTPHMSVGGVTDAYIGRVFEILASNVQRERDGKPLLNAVNRAVGY
jgi:phosphoglycerate dehydrogenase-like enzyme